MSSAPKMYAFWAVRPMSEDAPPASAMNRYFGIGLAVLGMVGIAVAALIPTMLVIDEKIFAQDQTLHRYNGYFVNCIDVPSSIESAGIQSKCKFAVFPSIPVLIEDMPACLVGEPKNGFTFKKQNFLFGLANFLTMVSGFFAACTVGFSFLRGTGCLRSARAAFAMSFLCGGAGCAAIISYYVAINPCKEDICSAMDDAVGTNGIVTCWALSPVGQIIAMLMVFVGGCCSQRWAANPFAQAQPDHVALMGDVTAPGAPSTPYTTIPAAYTVQANACRPTGC